MNIEIQVCGLFLMVTIFIMNLIAGRRRFILYSSKLFIAALSVAIFTICFDILSMIALFYIDTNPTWMTETACKAYIIGLVFEATSALIYSMYDCFPYEKYKKIAYTFLGYDILSTIAIIMLPIKFNVDDPSHAFTEGPAVLATYFSCLLVLIITAVLLVRYRKKMNRQRHRGVVLWVVCWIGAALVQFVNNQLLLIGFATAIGMTILFAILENPIAGLDRVSGVFNLPMLHEFMNQQYNRKIPFSMISVSFSTQPGIIEAEKDLRDSLVAYFETIAGARVFRNNRSGFVMIFEYGKCDLAEIIKKLRKDFSREWIYGYHGGKERLLSPTFLVMEDNSVVESAPMIFALSNYAFNKSVDDTGAVIYLDEQMAREAREFEKHKDAMIAAIKQDRVVVFYQPIWSVEEEKFVSVEALVRIREKDGTIIPPGLFIPVAEETGHILELGRIVFEKVCEFIRKEDPRRLGIEYIEVNLSVKQCEQRELSAAYRGILREYGIDPSYINLEITESSSIEIRQNVIDNMNELIRFGVNFSLDDFGNGQSNLDYIIDMPVAIVKFDRNMVQSYFVNERARLVMGTIVDMIHKMNLKIVAEGVERREELEELKRIGIEYIQGFYFSKPLPEREFLDFVKKHNLKEK
ncbi:MAG: EAL domain-containing protein [Eubacterium sp.]|nr:EAL domain-containing protein [Eubacterium sp.]